MTHQTKIIPRQQAFFCIKIHLMKIKICSQSKLYRKILQVRFPFVSDYKHDIWQLWLSASQVAIVSHCFD